MGGEKKRKRFFKLEILIQNNKKLLYPLSKFISVSPSLFEKEKKKESVPKK